MDRDPLDSGKDVVETVNILITSILELDTEHRSLFLKLLIIKLNDNEVDLVLQMGNIRVENTESNIYPFSHYDSS